MVEVHRSMKRLCARGDTKSLNSEILRDISGDKCQFRLEVHET